MSNIKKYSKLRLALLFGLYYENEKAKLERELLFNSVNTLFTREFNATNKLRWEIRPTFTYRPDDIFTFKFNYYFKLPINTRLDVVAFDEITKDERVDKFHDLQASISAKISKNIAVIIQYRYLKDFAPKREYQVNADNIPILIVGQGKYKFL